MARGVLIVDDADINREILHMFFQEQYKIFEAADGEEAIAQIKKNYNEISLILLDQMMPKKSGMEVLEFMRHAELLDRIPVIMITGDTNDQLAVKAYEYAVADIIYKPFNHDIVLRRCKNIIELYEARKEMEKRLAERTRDLRRSQEQLEKHSEFLLNALGSVVEFRSHESPEHIQRVKDVTRVLLKYVQQHYPEYGITDRQAKMIVDATGLHDLGKIAVPDSILNKPKKLTREEYAVIKRHTVDGCEILEQFKSLDTEFFKYCYEICRWHHEKYDGNGYPDRLVGEQIPIWSQVVCMADCFDAMVSRRAYKEPFAVEKASKMIKDGDCGVFSPKLLDCLELAYYDLNQLVEGYNYIESRGPNGNVETQKEREDRQFEERKRARKKI